MTAASASARNWQPRFSRASWAVLALALAIIALSLAQAAYYLGLPSDGWSFTRDVSGTGQQLIFAQNLSGAPSPLVAGDQLLAIEGQPVDQLRERALLAHPQPPQQWAVGQSIRYTVLRGEHSLALDVRLVHLSGAALARHLFWYYLANPSLLPAIVIGLFVFLHSPRDPAARLLFLLCTCFFASTGICQALRGSNVLGPADLLDRSSYWPAEFFNSLIWPFMIAPLFIHLFLSFPDAKWPVRAHQRLALSISYGLTPALTLLVLGLHWGRPLEIWRAWGGLSVAVYFTTLGAVVASMVHTLASKHDSRTRAQVRWLSWGALVTSAGAIGGGVLGSLGLLGAYPLLDFMVFRLPMLAFPVALAFAITRYHLFDIDIIIHRTLVYSALTVVLALVYISSVVTLQGFLRALSREGQSSLVTVASTLTIALLFSPLRRQIQSLIDRRFFRRKYDAARVLTVFSARMRDEVDLNRVTDDLLEVVEDAMQPTFVSLWLFNASGCLHVADVTGRWSSPSDPALP
jgi:hypothetical protein